MLQDLLQESEEQLLERAFDWKAFRKSNMLTQKTLAENLGLCRRTIQLIETARRTPRAQTLRRFEMYRRKFDINADLDSSRYIFGKEKSRWQ